MLSNPIIIDGLQGMFHVFDLIIGAQTQFIGMTLLLLNMYLNTCKAC